MQKDRLTVWMVCLLCVLGAMVAEAGAAKQNVVLSASSQSKTARSILDLQIEKIDVQGSHMTETLRIIAEAVRGRSGGKLTFDYSIRYSRAIEYAGKGIDAGKWKLRDPVVRITKFNTTLRDVLNELSRQASWSYEVTPTVIFIDDRRYFRESVKTK